MMEARELGNTWIGGLREWVKWLGGDSPVPEKRSKIILAATAGAVVVLLVGATFAMGGSSKRPHAKAAHQATAYGTVPQSAGAATQPSQPALSVTALLQAHDHQGAATTTTSVPTTTTTTAPVAGRKGTHSRTRHGARRARATTTRGP